MSDAITEAIRIPPKPGSLRSVAQRAASWWVHHLLIEDESDIIDDELDDDTEEIADEEEDDTPPRIRFRRQWTTVIQSRLVLEEDNNVWMITSAHPLLVRTALDSGLIRPAWPQTIAMEVSYREGEARIRVHESGRWHEYYVSQVGSTDS